MTAPSLRKLAESQAEAAGLREAPSEIHTCDTHEGCEACALTRSILSSSPSPAAQAIGRVLEAAREETDAARERELAMARGETPNLDWARWPLARDALREAVDALQALRAGEVEGKGNDDGI